MSDDPEVQSLAERIEDHLNAIAAESRAIRTVLETFLRRVLSTSRDPHQSFDALKADTLAVLQDETEAAVGSPNAQRAAAAALFQAEAIFAELEGFLPPRADPKPPTPN